ncbi:MAG: PQQ-dependent sugar dehydrogenase [Patescibacteria group bacterium]|jgi:glucose/arabinose dehydrogenase
MINLPVRKRIIVPLVLLVGVFGFALIASVQTTPAPLVEGSLVLTQGDPRVYFIQNGKRRWIVSEEAFRAQFFQWSEIISVESQRLAMYPEGEVIHASPSLGRVPAQSLLPDLAPTAPYDLRFAVENGRTRLRFTATFWNRGKGAMELNASAEANAADGAYDASQRIFQPDGTFVDKPVGTLFWHGVHAHYHYNDFGIYKLEMIGSAAVSAPIQPVVTQKTTFCLRDDLAIGAPSEGAKQAAKYNGCHGHKQGVSVGWADVYPYTLADQFLDVTDLPAGTYRLSFSVDPQSHFSEMTRSNNESFTILQLDPAKRTMQIIAVASAYESPNNRYADGMLVRAEGENRIYVIRGNKKRWIPNEQTFNAYGFSWGSIYTFPKGVIDAIPSERLIKVTGQGTLYFVNNAGYKRRVLNPDVLRSYNLSGVNVTEINQMEFDAIPSSDLIMKSGDTRVYSIGSRSFVGTFEKLVLLGLDPTSVHTVNNTDFSAYAVSVVTTGLNVPWDIVFLPDGDMLVTERSGTVRRLGKQPATITIPSVKTIGEGGLMGLALHPNFAQNQFVYLYFTSSENGTENKITRFKLNGTSLIEDKTIIDGIPAAIYHDGGQITFGPDGMLYVTIGDANTSETAQNLGSLAGKTLRLTPDGGIPSDNPFGSAVWSYGHRNAQGITWDAQGRMWQTEHGRSGALSGLDELNMIEKGKNYGWPTIQGDAAREGMVRPVRHSGENVTWAPSGIAYVNGSVYFAGLKGASLYQARIAENGTISEFKTHISGVYGRLRAVVLGPDGALYITTSNRDGRGVPKTGDDKVLRVHPDFLP